MYTLFFFVDLLVGCVCVSNVEFCAGISLCGCVCSAGLYVIVSTIVLQAGCVFEHIVHRSSLGFVNMAANDPQLLRGRMLTMVYRRR